jgi:hypothetical protein
MRRAASDGMDFPLELNFKLIAIARQISVRDATGQLVCYVKQKAFKLREQISVYADEAQTRPLFFIDADRMIDIGAEYRIVDAEERELGTVKQSGLRSFWRAHYEVKRRGAHVLTLNEENPWVKAADHLFGQLPVIGILSGYVFHPTYLVTRADTGAVVMRVEKRPALFEGRFDIQLEQPVAHEEQLLGVLSVLMMLLLERSRG